MKKNIFIILAFLLTGLPSYSFALSPGLSACVERACETGYTIVSPGRDCETTSTTCYGSGGLMGVVDCKSCPENYELKTMMVSLGEGQFVISHGACIGINIEQYNGIVSASQFEDIVNGKFRNSNVISGSVNLQAIRQESLLGKDSIFNLEGNTLFINVQGI